MKKSKYFYDYTRNKSEEVEQTRVIPSYYKGNTYGYEARKVVEEFQPNNFNLGTALTYLMRAGKKTYVNNNPEESMVEDIRKAINHLQFELDRWENK